MTMMSSTDIFYVIMSHQCVWALFLTIVPNTDVNLILGLREYRSLNINEKFTLEE